MYDYTINDLPKTNDSVERWRNSFSSFIEVSNPNIFSFLQNLKDYQGLMIEEGKSQRKVSTTLNIKIPTVYRIVKTLRDKGKAVAGKIGGHKPPSLTEKMKRKLVETINDDSTICIDGII
ncbi:hypothetical protein RF11_04316 [Thelohanellus kitauei]|uniref:Uncharacterized protein n=1 Tax=Thelohanellus kitauei TaxID=669202 RepID=A0A0C2NAD1_THEKT|nr:hypothetical protein RF11_04316 [Thelohanellus kitauei]